MSYLMKQLSSFGLVLVAGLALASMVVAILALLLLLMSVGVLANNSDSSFGPLGLIFLLLALGALFLARDAINWLRRHLALSIPTTAANLVGVYAGGSSAAVAVWAACAEAVPGMPASRPVLALGLAVLAAVAFWVAKPIELLAGLAAGLVVVAVGVFWWLTVNTAAVGCPWYEPPTPIPVPTTTTMTGTNP